MSLLARSINLIKFHAFIKAATKSLSTKCVTREIIRQPKPCIPLLGIQSGLNSNWIYHEPAPLQNPLIENSIRFPNGLLWVPPDEDPDDFNGRDSIKIDAPTTIENTIEKQAARLIVIRRKKMKKHKLKKLRKRMKYEWAKVRQRRELKKEKAFQAGLIAQCHEAEAFDAGKYVQDRLDKLHEIIIPKRWKGRRLPEFLIREKMGLPPKK
ncbi:uncharacterized protein [Atheta coriaria]|uniref:uncharacterized protein n=1 Tax=Dalotia coriaria TaxID=877792 RepID=UPI0031F36C90